MSEKFTPGPWRVIDSHDGPYVRSKGGLIAGGVRTSHWPGQDERYLAELEERVANARLISAAPDLYEALKAIMDDVEPTEFALSSHIRDAARSALAKARGETS